MLFPVKINSELQHVVAMEKAIYIEPSLVVINLEGTEASLGNNDDGDNAGGGQS